MLNINEQKDYFVYCSNCNEQLKIPISANINADIPASEMMTWKDGEYTYYIAVYEGVSPTAFANGYAFTVKLGGVATGQTLNYNVYANIYMLADGGDNAASLVKALYSYAEAVKQYNA